MEKVIDMYQPLENLPTCSNGKPGVDAHIWHEEQEYVSEFACEANKGIIKHFGQTPKCFKHEVLTQICIFVTGSYESVTDEFQWKYVSGCYNAGKAEQMEVAQPLTSYMFENIPIKIFAVDTSLIE